MDLIILIDNLYEINNTYELSSEDNKMKWLNLLNLLQKFETSQKNYKIVDTSLEKEILLKNSNLFLLCQSKEQEDYLLYLQTILNKRGLQLKQGISEEQMVESGIAYAIILLLEKQFNSIIKKQQQSSMSSSKQNSQSQSFFKSIHKVLDYDYFYDNNVSDNFKKYENIQKYEDFSNNVFHNKNSIEDGLLPYLLEQQQDQYLTDSPLKIKMINSKNIQQKEKSFQNNLFYKQNQYSKSKSLKKDNYNKNGEEIYECFLKEDFILNLCILFSRFFESFQKTSNIFTQGRSPCLGHYFLNLISQKKVIDSSQEQNKYVHISILNENSIQQNSIQQNIFTPQKISTPEAMRKIQDNNYSISSNKENIQDQVYISNFLQSNEQSLNKKNNLLDKKQRDITQLPRHSIDKDRVVIVDSPKQHKKLHKKNERYNSNIQTRDTKFEESQQQICQLDLEKRRFQQYSFEQSKQIQEMNCLYNELKNKYENLLEQTISKVQSFTKQQEILDQKEIFWLSTQNQSQNNLVDNAVSKIKKFETDQSQIESNECNEVRNISKSKTNIIENESDITRRQIVNDIFNQNSFLQSQGKNIELNDSSSSGSSQVSLPLFNYVQISDIWSNRLKQPLKFDKSSDSDKDAKPYTIKDFLLITISIIIIIIIVFLILFY